MGCIPCNIQLNKANSLDITISQCQIRGSITKKLHPPHIQRPADQITGPLDDNPIGKSDFNHDRPFTCFHTAHIHTDGRDRILQKDLQATFRTFTWQHLDEMNAFWRGIDAAIGVITTVHFSDTRFVGGYIMPILEQGECKPVIHTVVIHTPPGISSSKTACRAEGWRSVGTSAIRS